MSTDPGEAGLSPDQRQVLQVIYELWSAEIKWPLFGYLDAVLDQEHEIELSSVLSTVPDELVVYTRIPSASDDSEVRLTIAGIAQCKHSLGDVQLFMRALKWCVRRQKEHRPASTKPEQLKLTSTEAAADWTADGAEVSDVILAKAYSLLTSENISWGSGQTGGIPHDWHVFIHRDIRRFRPVDTLDDYLRIKNEQHRVQPPRLPVIPRIGLRTSLFQPYPSPLLPTSSPALAFDELHPVVRDAASPLFATQQLRLGVLEAGLALRNVVRERSDLSETNDSTLMGRAFGGKTPAIVLADLTTETGQNIQRGVAHLAQAILAAVRNPLTHESGEIPMAEAMEMLAMMSHVLRRIDAASWNSSSASTASTWP
jgi:uncharacterized protein (TIGR02391 family)